MCALIHNNNNVIFIYIWVKENLKPVGGVKIVQIGYYDKFDQMLWVLSQKPYIREDCLCRTLSIAEIDGFVVISIAILVQANQQLEYIVTAGYTQVPGVRFISAEKKDDFYYWKILFDK